MTHDDARQILIDNQCAPDAPGASQTSVRIDGKPVFVTCEIWNRHVYARREADRELAARKQMDARIELQQTGFHEGERVTMIAPSMLPGAPGRTYAGTVKISKWGQIYVAAKGERLSLERNPWRKSNE